MSDGESAQPVRKSRRWILITLLAVLVAGGGGVVAAAAYFYKENVTQIDRRYPEIVVREYVEATLNTHDDGHASLFACSDQTALKPFLDLRADLQAEERKFGLSISVVVGPRTVDGASVATELQIRRLANNITRKELQRWRFTMIQDDGWRVCSAQRLPDPTPSSSVSQPAAASPVA